ncbi:MAG: hypothetical protein A2428_09415 [Bdellovibrionales bacterium RIFOXYC1_FULL_54_43]|nr:MAG: hypothetical protein A2428_09415 [Bdellovibrionales bacterium RIFOXYC1_FULL_54_43]
MTIALLILLPLLGLWTILASSLLNAAIGLAATSATLTLVLFTIESPLAGVFELSVCAGLITVVFVSAISLTSRYTDHEMAERDSSRRKRFFLLPVLMAAVGAAFWFLGAEQPVLPELAASAAGEVREVIWTIRRLDLVGQILIVLSGVFGIVVLFKSRKECRCGCEAKEQLP